MTISKSYSVNDIRTLLASNNRAVERGILAIYSLQTEDEQSSENTRHHNNVGFSGCYARSGSYYAKWLLSGRNLTGKHLDNARKICIHHASQLTNIANSNLNHNK
jgi:hypothetical protein